VQTNKPNVNRTSNERIVRIGLRIAIGAVFLAAGVAKLAAHAETTAIVASRHLPAPASVAVAVGLGEALGGLLLIGAWRVRWVASALAAFVIVASLLLHFPIALVGPAAFAFGLDLSMVIALYAIATRDPSLGDTLS
jgi:uncharacterized membrane protein YphA (DoxX/SURF4 family)